MQDNDYGRMPQTEVEAANNDSKKKRRTKKKDEEAAVACVLCRHDHASCDNCRPCKRCTTKGVPHLCVTEYRKRGRPSKKLEEICLGNEKATSTTRLFVNLPEVPTNNPIPAITTLTHQENDSMLSMLMLPEYIVDDSYSPFLPTIAPAIETPSCPVLGDTHMITIDPCNDIYPIRLTGKDIVEKVSEIGILLLCSDAFFRPCTTSLLQKLSPTNHEFVALMHRTKTLVDGLCNSNEEVLTTFYNKKVFQLKQLYSELSIPTIISSGLIIIYLNSAAIDLMCMTREFILNDKCMIVGLLAPDDIEKLVTRWCRALIEYTHIDKIKVRVDRPTGTLECVLNTTIHREPFSGAPLLETTFLVPIA